MIMIDILTMGILSSLGTRMMEQKELIRVVGIGVKAINFRLVRLKEFGFINTGDQTFQAPQCTFVGQMEHQSPGPGRPRTVWYITELGSNALAIAFKVQDLSVRTGDPIKWVIPDHQELLRMRGLEIEIERLLGENYRLANLLHQR